MKKLLLLSLIIALYSCKQDDPVALDSPTATTASDITNNQFMANFDNVTGATGYDLDVATDVVFATIIETKTALGGSTVVDAGIAANTEYWYRVRATASGATTSAYSNTISVITLPDAPVATDATNITSNGFIANWQAVTGITTYKLYVSENNPVVAPYVAELSVTGTSQDVTGLISGKFYYYEVEAISDTRVSARSNFKSVQTN